MNPDLSAPRGSSASAKTILSVVVFLIIVIAGLSYIKWFPYWDKAHLAASKHSIGSSIVSGKLPTAPAPSWDAAWNYAVAYYKAVWKAAVFGILLGSLVQVMIPRQWLARVLGRTTFGSTAIAGLASVPGMMCSCCAAPMAVGLRKRHVSIGAALAFWLGNPMINPATLIFMGFVLSWKFTILRLIAGLVLVFVVSHLANRLAPDATVPADKIGAVRDAEEPETSSVWVRWLRSIWQLTLNVVPAYVLAVLVLGAVRAWLFPEIGPAASGLLAIIGLSIAGMLFVIPTAGEIPIAQTLMSFGLGAGPAAALIITLPAVSLPSVLIVAKAFPARVLFFVMGCVVALGIVGGIIGSFVL